MDKYLWEHVQIFLEREDLLCLVVRTRLDCDSCRPLVDQVGTGTSFDCVFWCWPIDHFLLATPPRPKVPVVETAPSSIAAVPAVANSPQLFEPTDSECAAFPTISDVHALGLVPIWAWQCSGVQKAVVPLRLRRRRDGSRSCARQPACRPV